MMEREHLIAMVFLSNHITPVWSRKKSHGTDSNLEKFYKISYLYSLKMSRYEKHEQLI